MLLPRLHQPIVAIATAPGRGAVGIVRASGRDLAPLIEAALWPLVTLLLLAPQLRAPDPDQNRPL